MKRLFALGLLLVLLPAAAAETYTVTVSQSDDSSSYYFEPNVLQVAVGDTVRFEWGNGSHNVAQASDGEAKSYVSGFYSGDPQVGGNWTLPAEYTATDGTLDYLCVPHVSMGMRGSIIVGSGAVPIPEIALEFGEFPWLSYLLVIPLLGAMWCWGFRHHPEAPRVIALGTTLATLLLSVIIFLKAGSSSGYRLMEEYVWSSQFGVSLLLGVDGLSVPMVLLTGILGPLTVLFAWEEQKRPALFFGLLLLLQTATLGVFVTLDYFVFYLFWEVVLIPMFFLIAIWGGPARRYAAYKFFIYTFTASLVMLVGFMALYFEAGVNTFSMIEIAKQSSNFAPAFQKWVFAALFIGFAVKMPMVPFHTWLPDAHVEAPTAGSIVLAGVMLKLGLYGLMRAALAPLPLGAEYFVPVMVTLAIVSIIYGAALSLAQTDLKKLVAYSSISHMGIALLGVATLTELGLAGAVYMMFAHGLLSPAMFMIAGVVLHQLGTRDIPKLGGLAQKQPYTATLFVVIFLGSLGLPGMATFVAELSVFVAFFQSHGYWLLLPISGMVLTAGYHLWALQRSVFGPLSKKVDIEKVHEAPWYEQWPLFVIVTLAVLFGVLPQLLMSPVTVACYDILRLMGGV